MLKCTIAHPWLCVAGKPDPQVDIACEAALDDYGNCLPSCEGGVSSSGDCSISCGGKQPFGAECQPGPSGALQCRCTEGAFVGKGFNIGGSCNDQDWRTEASKQCTP